MSPVDLTQYFDARSSLFVELGFRKDALGILKKYVLMLWESNAELNLISRKMTVAEFIDNHVIDCLLPLRQFPTTVKTVADFGTGGGLPGLIYAIQFPEIKFRLFEKSGKKQEFLEKCKLITHNISVEGEIPSYLVDVDVILARGFKPLDVILEMSRSAYQKKIKYFLLKARLAKINDEKVLAQKKFKDLKIEITPLKSPVLEVERHLIQIN